MPAAGASSIPRISLPGVTAPFPVAPRRPPAPDDPLDAARLRAPPPGARRGAGRPAATGQALRPLASRPPPRRRRRAKQKTACRPHPPRLAAASGPPARPAPCYQAHPRGARDPERPPRPRLRRAGASRHVVTSPTPPLRAREADARHRVGQARRSASPRTPSRATCPTAQPGRASGPTRGSHFRLNSTHEPARQHPASQGQDRPFGLSARLPLDLRARRRAARPTPASAASMATRTTATRRASSAPRSRATPTASTIPTAC